MTPARRFTIAALSVVALAAPAIAQPAKTPIPEPPPVITATFPAISICWSSCVTGLHRIAAGPLQASKGNATAESN